MTAWVKKVEAGSRIVHVRELTVGEIRNWLKDIEARAADGDLVTLTLFEGLSLDDLPLMTDLSVEDVDALKPSELAEIKAAIEEVNADFFAMRGRWKAPAMP